MFTNDSAKNLLATDKDDRNYVFSKILIKIFLIKVLFCVFSIKIICATCCKIVPSL